MMANGNMLDRGIADTRCAASSRLRQYVGPEATIQEVVRPGYRRGEAREACEQALARFINGGQATTAYSVRVAVRPKVDWLARDPFKVVPDYQHSRVERCYRVSSEDEAARRVVDLALEYQDDPYAPKIYAVYDLADGGWVSEMELLEQAYAPRMYADTSKLLYDWQLGEDWRYEGRYGNVVPSRLLIDKSAFVRAVDRLRVRLGAKYDLHGANVMKRGEQIVVLDPLYKY